MCIRQSGSGDFGCAYKRLRVASYLTTIIQDPFCALDNKVEEQIWTSLFGQRGLFVGKTVILATNSVKRFRNANQIIYLKDGTVAAQGDYEQMVNHKDTSFKMFLALSSDQNTSLTALAHPGSPNTKSDYPKEMLAEQSTNTEDAIDSEAMATTQGVYKAVVLYLRAGGWFRTAITAFLGCTSKFRLHLIFLEVP